MLMIFILGFLMLLGGFDEVCKVEVCVDDDMKDEDEFVYYGE